MSGEYTPETGTPTTESVDYSELGRTVEQLSGVDLGRIGEAVGGLDFGGDLPPAPVEPVEETELPDGVSEEIAEQAAEHGVDPSELVAQDTSVDGTPDYYYTENADGNTTFSAFDQDQDGTLEYVSVDTDHDGNFDYTTGDTDGDGVPDSTITYP